MSLAFAPRGGDASGARLRVLVVDDEASICRALSMALVRVGCDPLVAHDGESALSVLHAGRVDVLVLDLHMADMRGDTLFHLATSLQPHLRHQTMFLTGDVTERGDALISACGTPFLRKPFDLSLMLEIVRALAPQRHSASA